MSGQKRKFAMLLAAVLCVIMLFSVSFVAENADHECATPGKCPICYQISVSENTVKKLTVAAIFSAVVIFLFAAARVNPVCFAVCFIITLVSLKVKLSN